MRGDVGAVLHQRFKERRPQSGGPEFAARVLRRAREPEELLHLDDAAIEPAISDVSHPPLAVGKRCICTMI
jgi:hypothetical protein